MVAQGLQARRQPQHHHPQVARKAQQHLAHVFGLHRLFIHRAGRSIRLAGLLVHPHQLGGFQGQRCEVLAEGLADDFKGLVQVLAGVHQVTGGLHGLGAIHRLEDGRHRVGVGQLAFAGIQQFVRDERHRKRPRPGKRIHLFWQGMGRGRNQAGHIG